MKKGEDAIACTRKQFRDSIEIQIYIYMSMCVCVSYGILEFPRNMISCISKITHNTKIRWNVSHDNDYIEDNSRVLYK